MLLHTMHVYLLLLTALSNAARLYDACLFLFAYFALDSCIVIIYTNALCFSYLSLGY